MEEKKIFFAANKVQIEGLLSQSPGEAAMIVTHPHPLYGGNMYNNVVESVIKAYNQAGYTTLRFNFRGVGQSGGSHTSGQAEQEDVLGAIHYLNSLNKTSINLIGYSFGAWVIALGINRFPNISRAGMISPPVNFIDFGFQGHTPKLHLVITGSQDEFSPPAMLKEMLPTWNPDAKFKIIQGADHFYLGKTGEIEEIIQDFLHQ